MTVGVIFKENASHLSDKDRNKVWELLGGVFMEESLKGSGNVIEHEKFSVRLINKSDYPGLLASAKDEYCYYGDTPAFILSADPDVLLSGPEKLKYLGPLAECFWIMLIANVPREVESKQLKKYRIVSDQMSRMEKEEHREILRELVDDGLYSEFYTFMQGILRR